MKACIFALPCGIVVQRKRIERHGDNKTSDVWYSEVIRTPYVLNKYSRLEGTQTIASPCLSYLPSQISAYMNMWTASVHPAAEVDKFCFPSS